MSNLKISTLRVSKKVYLENGLTEEMLKEALVCFKFKKEELYGGKLVETVEDVLILAEEVNEDMEGEDLIGESVDYIECELDEWRENEGERKI